MLKQESPVCKFQARTRPGPQNIIESRPGPTRPGPARGPRPGPCRALVFSILSLNCQSLNAKIDQINIKLQQLKSNGHEFSAICLQETWLSEDSDISLLEIDGYTFIPQGKICSAHGGLAIYLSSKYKFKSINMYENSGIWEGQFIEVTEIAKKNLL